MVQVLGRVDTSAGRSPDLSSGIAELVVSLSTGIATARSHNQTDRRSAPDAVSAKAPTSSSQGLMALRPRTWLFWRLVA